MRQFVPDELKALADLFAERNAQYGESYRQHGDLMKSLFPEGLTLTTAEDFARFAIINMIAGKLNRYTNNFHTGGHDDSLRDAAVYSIIELDLDKNGIRK